MLALKPYRIAAVPLLSVQTADPANIIRLAVREASNGTETAVLTWNCIHGIRAGNEAGKPLADLCNGDQPADIATSNPVEAIRKIEALGANDTAARAVVVFLGLADVLDDPQSQVATRQAVWNLRDALPPQGIMAVLVVPLGWRNPFPNDIAVAEDSLPDRAELSALVVKTTTAAKLAKPREDIMDKSADALIGLSGFAAEQATALSLKPSGVDVASLWNRKRQQIRETPGLSVYGGTERFDDLGGLAQAKEYFGAVVTGKRKPGCVVFVDEIEKSLAGSAGDTSGVSQSILGYLLSYMQDNRATGSILIGPGGSGKSAFAKAVGNEGGIPTVQLDLGGIKGSLVGESEGRMRAALAVITAVSAGRPMFLATCNSIGALPPELRRRFTLGTMFFDLPTAEEREIIWCLHCEKFDMPKPTAKILPECDGWTGAEIAACVDLADRLGKPLKEAAKYITPISRTAKELIELLRTACSGRYLSASAPGVYRKPETAALGRKLEL